MGNRGLVGKCCRHSFPGLTIAGTQKNSKELIKRNTHIKIGTLILNGTLILSKGILIMEHSYYQNGILIKIKGILIMEHSYYQNGILIKMEHSYYQKEILILKIGTLKNNSYYQNEILIMEHSYYQKEILIMEHSGNPPPIFSVIVKKNYNNKTSCINFFSCFHSKDHPRCRNWTLDFAPAFSPRF